MSNDNITPMTLAEAAKHIDGMVARQRSLLSLQAAAATVMAAVATLDGIKAQTEASKRALAEVETTHENRMKSLARDYLKATEQAAIDKAKQEADVRAQYEPAVRAAEETLADLRSKAKTAEASLAATLKAVELAKDEVADAAVARDAILAEKRAAAAELAAIREAITKARGI